MEFIYYIILSILILLLLGLGIYLLIGYCLYKFCLTRKGKMVRKIQKKYAAHLNMLSISNENFKDYKVIEIISEDKLKLKGFYKDNNFSKLAILVHGYGRDHLETGNIAQMFENKGYDILAIDMRSHGKSEGYAITMGQEESCDLLLWINKMLEFKAHYKIVLFGLSMGATTVCLTLGKNLPQNVVLAIEDCGFDNAEKELSYVYSKTKFHFKFIFKIFTKFVNKTIGLNLKSIDACQSLKNSRLPILFIHGEKDEFVPTEMVYNLSAQVPENRKSVYIALDSSHTLSSFVNKKTYEKKVYEFLDKYYM